MRAIGRHIRANVVAYLALFIALGGTSYAAVAIRNHSIRPINLNRQRFGGYIRAFASVEADGRIDSASPGASVMVSDVGVPGLYVIAWRLQDFSSCSAQAGVRALPDQGNAGSALASMVASAARRGHVGVTVYGPQGAHSALPFFVDVVCPTP